MTLYFTITAPSKSIRFRAMIAGSAMKMPAGQADRMSGNESAGFRREGTV